MQQLLQSQLFAWFIQEKVLREEDDIFDIQIKALSEKQMIRDGIVVIRC